MQKKVWISRSQPGASALARKLAVSNILAIERPVLSIVPINCLYPQERPKLVICLSGHAARIYLGSKASIANKAIKHLAIGRETASVLRSNLTNTIFPSDERSEGIIELKEIQDVAAGDVVWFLAGQKGRGMIENALEKKGCKLYRIALYEQVKNEVKGIEPEKISCVVVGSVGGVHHVWELWTRYNGTPSVPIIAPSLRVKKEAENLGFTEVYDVGSANLKDVSIFVEDFLSIG